MYPNIRYNYTFGRVSAECVHDLHCQVKRTLSVYPTCQVSVKQDLVCLVYAFVRIEIPKWTRIFTDL